MGIKEMFEALKKGEITQTTSQTTVTLRGCALASRRRIRTTTTGWPYPPSSKSTAGIQPAQLHLTPAFKPDLRGSHTIQPTQRSVKVTRGRSGC
jgi:hypothetical protein